MKEAQRREERRDAVNSISEGSCLRQRVRERGGKKASEDSLGERGKNDDREKSE